MCVCVCVCDPNKYQEKNYGIDNEKKNGPNTKMNPLSLKKLFLFASFNPFDLDYAQ